MSGAYRRHVEYHFEVLGEEMALTANDAGDHIDVEELRKNGQEDCHYGNGFALVDGKWQQEDPSCIEDRDSDDLRMDIAVMAYVTEHGLPDGEA